ncbi:MAG: helix-turn-helix domain-containing protein [Spirochaetota bacterium]
MNCHQEMVYHKGISLWEIARILQKHPSTISRKIKRNATDGY